MTAAKVTMTTGELKTDYCGGPLRIQTRYMASRRERGEKSCKNIKFNTLISQIKADI